MKSFLNQGSFIPIPRIILTTFLVLTISETSFGQVPGVISLEEIHKIRAERLEEEARRELEYQRMLGQRLLFDYGGWYRFNFLTYDDLANEPDHKLRRVVRMHDLRIWARLNLDDVHEFYARGRTSFSDWNSGHNYRRRDDDLNVELDQAYYSVRIDGAFRRYLDVKLPLSFLQFKGGKFFSRIGTGLVYSKIGLGVELKGRSPYVDFKLFFNRTPHGESNIDFSVPGFRTEGQRRYFYGLELTYPRFSRHKPYFFWVQQKDHSDVVPPDPDQSKFDYDSRYIGLGVKGEIIRNLTYEVEGTRETGRSYGDDEDLGVPQSPSDISAWAFTATLTKTFDVLTKPRLSVQYAMGTGDKGRTAFPTNTLFNAPGSTDRGFLYFGYIHTGYMLSPRLANLQMLRLGGALKPLDFHKDLKDNLEIGANFYLYRKHEAKAGINDFRADRPLSSLGKELDAYLNWKVFSDLFFTINYGRFYPSNAFSEKNARDYFLAGITLQF